ncbi:MAG TPA: hypothetical protein VNT28_04675 [Candidatus Limnocylindrales bacterium]|jgi:hypothetical protein|nr:hypothetical protein [Candidatus Limnocylindrales bacterium]
MSVTISISKRLAAAALGIAMAGLLAIGGAVLAIEYPADVPDTCLAELSSGMTAIPAGGSTSALKLDEFDPNTGGCNRRVTTAVAILNTHVKGLHVEAVTIHNQGKELRFHLNKKSPVPVVVAFEFRSAPQFSFEGCSEGGPVITCSEGDGDGDGGTEGGGTEGGGTEGGG